MAHPAEIQTLLDAAITHHAAGRVNDAAKLYRRILEIDPRSAVGLQGMGLVALDEKRVGDAVDLLRQATAADPELAMAHTNLANALLAAGDLAGSVSEGLRSLELRPGHAETHYNLSLALYRTGEMGGALEHAIAAVTVKPKYAKALRHLGRVYGWLLRPEEAERAYRAYLAIKPNDAMAIDEMGTQVMAQGRNRDAAMLFEAAGKIDTKAAIYPVHRGTALVAEGMLDEAAREFEQALRRAPDDSGALAGLAAVLKDRGKAAEAIELYRRAAKKDQPMIRQSMLFVMLFHPGMSAAEVLAEHVAWGREEAGGVEKCGPHGNTRDPERRLRIGYVGPTFRDHPVGMLIEPILANHDREQFEVVCYSDALRRDERTRRVEKIAALWRETARLSDGELAERVRADAIDVLVDLNGHMAQSRLMMFARKPAPVQVWFGYPATSGLAAMDYAISDMHMDPPGEHDEHYVEKLLRLPGSYWTYPADAEAPAIGEVPQIAAGQMTFGSLNNFLKNNRRTAELWRRVLDATPGSRLMVLVNCEVGGATVERELFASAGISQERLVLVGRKGRAAYLELFNQIDVSLDPVPYTGHTTAMDSLWMGVPVVSLAGDRAVGRAGVSILGNLGRGEWVARDEERYVEIATRLARDVEGLKAQRIVLREQMRGSAICDAAGNTRALEAAYRAAWRNWCASPV